ncbi:MAG: protein kinase, partial [Planctomycetota bacterium]
MPSHDDDEREDSSRNGSHEADRDGLARDPGESNALSASGQDADDLSINVSAAGVTSLVIDALVHAESQGQRVDAEALIEKHPHLEQDIRRCIRDFAAGAENLNAFFPGDAADEKRGDAADGENVPGQAIGRSMDRASGGPAALISQHHFALLHRHGRGGYGEVFLGFDETMQRDVAVKVLQRQHVENDDRRRRFITEAHVAGQLVHPGILPVFSHGESDDGRPFYTMPFVEEGSLSDAIKQFHVDRSPHYDAGDPDFRQLISRFISVCRTVAYVHERQVIHRDIKPQNVMLGRYGETWLVDWGSASSTDTSSRNEEAAEKPVAISGFSSKSSPSGGYTPAYASPEQLRGQAGDSASDIYSLGATLYKLLTSQAPSRGVLDRERRAAILAGNIPPARQLHASVPHKLGCICQRAMMPKPADRYADANALADDLEAYLNDAPIQAAPDRPIDRVFRSMRRRQFLVASAVISLLLMTATIAVASLFLGVASYRSENQSRRSLVFAAERTARLVGVEIDRRWMQLTIDAKEPAIVSETKALSRELDADGNLLVVVRQDATGRDAGNQNADGENGDSENSGSNDIKPGDFMPGDLDDSLRNLRLHLSEKLNRSVLTRDMDCYSMVIQSDQGLILARVPSVDSVVMRNFRYRTYFNGKPQDDPPSALSTITRRCVVSPTYLSKADNTLRVTLSVAINDPQSGDPIGRLAMSMMPGNLGLLDSN